VAFGFFEGPRISKVVGTGEELLGSVDGPCRFELSRPEQSEGDTQLRSEEVLPALTAREGEVGGIGPEPPSHEGEEGGILVVGVGADDEHPARLSELLQHGVESPDTSRRWRSELRSSL
jgi:hypothetical protein